MKRLLLCAALLTPLAAGSALAGNKCSVPQAEWQPQTALQQRLEAQGWKIARIRIDDGCYEVYGTDASGRRMETHFDPKSFAVVAAKSKS